MPVPVYALKLGCWKYRFHSFGIRARDGETTHTYTVLKLAHPLLNVRVRMERGISLGKRC